MSARETTSRRPSRRKRKYFIMSWDYLRSGAPGLRLENLEVVAPGKEWLAPPPGRRGFPSYPEPPRVLFDRKLGRMPRDLEMLGTYSLVSDRAKLVFQAVDPDAFAFERCDVVVPQGMYDGPAYWLCDVVRVLNALDVANSRLGSYTQTLSTGEVIRSLAGASYMTFKEDVVGDTLVFREPSISAAPIICDNVLKDACKAAGLKGIYFGDVLKL